MSKHRYLITGGLGFIGSHFVKCLIRAGVSMDDIVVLDKMTYASDYKRLSDIDITVIEGDIKNSQLLKELLNKYKITCVINFAAETHVDNSIVSQDDFVQTNIIGVQKLLEESQRYWSNRAKTSGAPYRFIQISTDEVYGSSDTDSNIKFNEASPLQPKNPYAATKASADLMIGAFVNTYNFPAIIVRSTNNYGLGQHKEKLIPKVIDAIKHDKDIPLYGDGEQKRTWLNVKDNCSAIYKIAENGRLGGIYNVVGPSSLSNKELVNLLILSYQSQKKAFYKGKIKYVEDRPGHDTFYNVDDYKIRTELNFIPSIDIEEGLENLIGNSF